MPFRIQYLAEPRGGGYAPAKPRRAVRGRLWIDVCRPVLRLSVAESIQRGAMRDLNTRVRIRPYHSAVKPLRIFPAQLRRSQHVAQ